MEDNRIQWIPHARYAYFGDNNLPDTLGRIPRRVEGERLGGAEYAIPEAESGEFHLGTVATVTRVSKDAATSWA